MKSNLEIVISPEEINRAKIEGIAPEKALQLRVLALIGYAMMIKQEPHLAKTAHIAKVARDKSLCEFEIKVLRAVRGDFDLEWGAAVGASLGLLKGSGYISGSAMAGWKITEKGEKFLAGLDVLTLEKEEGILHGHAKGV